MSEEQIIENIQESISESISTESETIQTESYIFVPVYDESTLNIAQPAFTGFTITALLSFFSLGVGVLINLLRRTST